MKKTLKLIKEENIKDDFYTEEVVSSFFDDDAITAEEEGFMRGYLTA